MSSQKVISEFEQPFDATVDWQVNSTMDWDCTADSLQSKLVLIAPNGQKLALAHGQRLSIGRAFESPHRTHTDLLMSRRHFSIEFSAGYAVLVDEQSTNGTFLNGDRIVNADLSDQDRIVAGSSTFVVLFVS